MELKINSFHNGALLIQDDGENTHRTLYKFDYDDPELGLRDLQCLLYDISEQLSMESRYSKERISIKIVHGDKYECKDKECAICKEDR
jgi:hypothetical protein